jgi:hypothetical protein
VEGRDVATLAGECRRKGRVDVDHGTGFRPRPVQVTMQLPLAAGLARAVGVAVAIDVDHVGRLHATGQDRARRDQQAIAKAHAEIAGGAGIETKLRKQPCRIQQRGATFIRNFERHQGDRARAEACRIRVTLYESPSPERCGALRAPHPTRQKRPGGAHVGCR